VGFRSFIDVIVGEGRERFTLVLVLFIARYLIARRLFETDDTIFIRHICTVAASGLQFHVGKCYLGRYLPQGLRIAIPAGSDVLDDGLYFSRT
jgi:hypothetical protein